MLSCMRGSLYLGHPNAGAKGRMVPEGCLLLCPIGTAYPANT